MAKKKEQVEEVESNGVGDVVEKIIKTVAPKIAEKYKDCIGCKNRKIWMNRNLNGKFG